MGFPSTCSDPPLALCFLCGEKLANSSMKQRPMFLTKLYSYDSICTLLIFIFTLPNRTHIYVHFIFSFSQKLYVSVKGVILRYLRGGTIVPPRSEPLTQGVGDKYPSTHPTPPCLSPSLPSPIHTCLPSPGPAHQPPASSPALQTLTFCSR